MITPSEPRRIWLAWEKQRRSETLSAAFQAKYFPLTSSAPRPWKYLSLGFRTIALLLRERPSLVFVQNPSVVLASMICALRSLFGYRIIMDRHSNLKPHTRGSKNLMWRGFHALSGYSNRVSDLTIVTNEAIADLVRRDGGSTVILQDMLPDMRSGASFDAGASRSAVFVCTFSDDEPVAEVMQAADSAVSLAKLFITGRPRLTRELTDLLGKANGRITLTGFLPDDAYKALINAADYAIVLTTAEDTLVCGAYEALSCGKPVVLADTSALRDYFRRGTVFCRPVAADITRAMNEVDARYVELVHEASLQRTWMRTDWEQRFAEVQARIERLTRTRERA